MVSAQIITIYSPFTNTFMHIKATTKQQATDCLGDYKFVFSTGHIIRLPDIFIGGLRFYSDSSFFLSPFFPQLPSELAERKLTKTGCMLGSKCDLNMLVRNLEVSPYKSGAQKPLFEDFAT